MQRIEFSEMTNRLHRNLVAIAGLIVIVVGFDIKIGKATTSGLELEILTTDVLLAVLIAVLIYHAFGVGIRAFEEYRLWELKFIDKESMTNIWSGDVTIVDIAHKMKATGGSLETVIQKRGDIIEHNKEIMTAADAGKLKEAAESALIYGKRFENFPTITRVRFWGWDIGLAAVISLVALAFAFSVFPSGIFSRCIAA